VTNTPNQESNARADWCFLLAHQLELIAGAISQWNTVVWEQAYELAQNLPHQAARQAAEELRHYKKLFHKYNVFGLPCSPEESQLQKLREEFIHIASQLRDW